MTAIDSRVLLIALRRYVVAGVLALAASASLAQSPNELIQQASDELASELNERRDELAADRNALYEMVNDIILPRFDRRYAAQLVLARHWRSASEKQRDAFVMALYNNLLRKYADGVLEFNQEQVEILPFRGDESKPRVTVRTLVTMDDGTKVPVDYNLVRRDSGWMVFDVIIEGISYIRNFRAEINSELQTKTLDEVIARLQSEAADSSELASE